MSTQQKDTMQDTLILNFSASRTMRNNFIVYDHQVYGNSLKQKVTLLGNGLPAGKAFLVEWASDLIGLAFSYRWEMWSGHPSSQPVTFRLKQSCHLLLPSPLLVTCQTALKIMDLPTTVKWDNSLRSFCLSLCPSWELLAGLQIALNSFA